MDIVNSGKSSISTKKGVVSINQNDDNFLFYDGDVYRMIIGFDDDNEPIVKISESGVSILEASNDQLIFNSSQNVFKIVHVGTAQLTAPNTSRSGIGFAGETSFLSIPHNLGYVPAIIAYTKNGNAYYQMPYTSRTTMSVSSYIVRDFIQVYTTETDVVFIIETELTAVAAGSHSKNGLTYDFKYYLLQETASL